MSIFSYHYMQHQLVDTDLPCYTYFDYVEVYNYDEALDSFSLNFRDDFDTFDIIDSERWVVSVDKTVYDMSSTFSDQNASVETTGHLALKLSQNTEYEHPCEPGMLCYGDDVTLDPCELLGTCGIDLDEHCFFFPDDSVC